LLTNPFVVRYVTSVAERVARHSDLQVPVHVRVIDTGEINAFALPGGHFFITTGMLLEVETEAELAGVISHEVAHVAARHATRQMTRAQVWNLVSLPLVFVGGSVAYAIQQAASLAVPLTFLKFSRNAEKEADLLGLQYHYASGYDPVAFVNFFERIRGREKREKKEEHRGIVGMFSTHPMTQDRIVAAERFIEGHLPAREEYVVNTSEHDGIHSYLRRLLLEREQQEATEGPVLRKRMEGNSKPENGKKRDLS
jgi:predicted Zn-dependent protease